MTFFRRILIIVIYLLGYCTLSFADMESLSVARITEISGPVTIIREDESKIPAIPGLALYPGDTVVTGQDGRAAFTFDRGDTFRLYEDSQLAIDEFAELDKEEQPILRLDLGQLWTRIRDKLSTRFTPSFHTPTTVIGIRGTEFETVVSMDAASAVAVDEGAVEMEAETGRVTIPEGMTAEVDMDEKIVPPFKAPPREQRQWKKWRQKKREKLVEKLPDKTPHMRKRFEKAVDRYLQASERISRAADRLDAQIEAVRKAISTGKRGRAKAGLQKIRAMENRFRQNLPKYRKGLNRLKVASKHSIRLEKFAQQNRERFPANKVDGILADLVAIKQKRKQLKHTVRQTIGKVRKTRQNLRSLKQEIRQQKSKHGQKRKQS